MTNYISTLSPNHNIISIFDINIFTPIPFANNKPPLRMAYPPPYKPVLNNNQTIDEMDTPITVPHQDLDLKY